MVRYAGRREAQHGNKEDQSASYILKCKRKQNKSTVTAGEPFLKGEI
jgi:hypothetical protein